MRNSLYPKASGFEIWQALRISLASALIAGTFGILHDQVTYTLSPEYFTRMKFDQFRGADFGFPLRVFVSEIGFLATWWVGLIGGWFLARVAIPRCPLPMKSVILAMGAIVVLVIILAIGAGFAGPSILAERDGWKEALESMQVSDSVAFDRVAAIHFASYSGALVGWIGAMIVFWTRPPLPPATVE